MQQNNLIFSFLLLSGLTHQAKAYTLEESYNHALVNYQTDKLSDSRIDQSVEYKSQIKGTYLPKIMAQGTYQKQELSEDQKTVGLNLKTNLFNGGKDKRSVENADLSIEIAKNLKQLDRINLYSEVVESYFNYQLYLNDLKNVNLLQSQSRNRTTELQKRLDIGRSRKGELLQAEAQLSSVEATKRNAEGLVNQYESVFIKLTGLDKNPGMDISFAPIKNFKTKEEYIEAALKREDVVNKELVLKQAENSYQIADSHFMPSLDLNSNAYALKEGGSQSSRNSDWDIGVTLSIPLYEGGISQAKKRQELAKVTTSKVEIVNFKKDIEIDVTRKYEQFIRYYDQISAYEKALDRSKRSYEETQKDYRLGLVTNLDVISSLNLYLDNKRESEKSRIQAMMNLKLLEASAGMIP